MEKGKNRKTKLAIGVISGILLYCSWCLTPGVRIGTGTDYQAAAGIFWDQLDLDVFYCFNGLLMEPGLWRDILAVANNRLFDLVPAVLMILIYSFFVFSGDRKERRKRIVLGAFMSIYMFVSVQAMSLLVFRFHRSSPTKAQGVSQSIRISKLYDWKIKDASRVSFPGDHATVLMIFTGFMSFYGRKKRYIIPALAITIVFSLPRLFSGAHWLSDIMVGSASTALIFLPIAFYTPLADKCGAVLAPPVNKICDFLARFIPALRTDESGRATRSGV
ncbi:MAG: phosphatase PAP2 family protein [Phycisphaerae bacterium]|jgi:membrane-associated phospholipid phosphatase|nr:phosphatase PAP2 family protein [Phycisphaerae bacterium]